MSYSFYQHIAYHIQSARSISVLILSGKPYRWLPAYNNFIFHLDEPTLST